MSKTSLHASVLLAILVSLAPLGVTQSVFDELDSETAHSEESEKEAFEAFKKRENEAFAAYKKKLEEEFQEYKKIAAQETQNYQQVVNKVWDTPELSSKKVWVEYSKDLTTKNRVDFDKQTIAISTTVKKGGQFSEPDIRAKLKTLLVKNQAQAFQDDVVAQAIEKKSKEKITLLETANVKPSPILLPLVARDNNPDDAEVNKIVDDMLQRQEKKTRSNKNGDTVVTIEVAMRKDAEDARKIKAEPTKDTTTETRDKTPDEGEAKDAVVSPSKKPKVMADLRVNKLPSAAREVEQEVRTFAQKAKLDHALVFAVIETESAFNPMAKSPIPAYGLMQIVPGSAGMDATQQLFGKGRILSPSYLYNRDKNIEIGSIYLNILYFRYLKKISNPTSRLYCSIAAYNTGAGNVSVAFIGNKKIGNAFAKINAMTPQQVYDHLIENLPYEEARHYLQRVVSRMEKYSI